MILPPMPHAEYSQLDGLNWSLAKELAISPKQFQFRLENPREITEALRFGIAVHTVVLEPERFAERFVCYREPKNRGEGSKKRWEAFQVEAAAAGKWILDADEYDRALAAGAAVLANPLAERYLSAGVREQVVTWTDEATGIVCRGRCDHVGSHLFELKTAARVDQRLFASQAASLLYPEQAAFYRRGLRANGIAVDDTPILSVVESVRPHDSLVYRLPEDVMLAADDRVSTLLALLKKCREEDRWPGRCEEEIDFRLPAWARPFDDGLELVGPDGEAVTL